MSIDELCYKVIGAAMAVHRHFGAGYLEEVYKNALLVELGLLGIGVEKEIPIAVNYRGCRVGDYRADAIVEGRLILELKAVTTFNTSHEVQLVNYLNATVKSSSPCVSRQDSRDSQDRGACGMSRSVQSRRVQF